MKLNLARTGLLFLLIALTASLAAAQTPTRRVVAYSGGPAPGSGGGTFAAFYLPVVMGSNGDIAFHAAYTSAGGSGGPEGIFVERGGQPLRLLFKQFDISALPDFQFIFFKYPGINTYGYVDFNARVQHISGSHQIRAIFVEESGGLRAVISERATVNGTTFDAIGDSYGLASDLGDKIFHASTSGTVSSTASMWMEDGSNLSLIARTGAEGGLTGFGETVINPVGLVAFKASVGSQESVWVMPDGALMPTELARTRQPLPGIAADEVLSAISPLMTNAEGRVAFSGTIKHHLYDYITMGYGIWMTGPNGANLQLVFRQDNDAPRPGPGVGFTDVLTDRNRIASISGARLPSGSGEVGIILINQTAGYSWVAKRGEPAPGIPGATFLVFDQLTANGNGQVAFRATVTGAGITSANNTGIWAQGADLQLRLLARTGETIEVAPGNTRPIHFLELTYGPQGSGGSDGRFRQFSDRGDVVFVARNSPDIYVGSPETILATNVGAAVAEPKLIGLEVVQVVQDWNNSVPLVTGKRTLVRAHVENLTPMRFDGRLRGFSGGLELPGSPLAPKNPGGYVKINAPGAQNRDQLKLSTYFELPREWLTGVLSLKMEWLDGELLCEEAAGPVANDCRVDVGFAPVLQPQIHFVSVAFEQNGVLSFVPPLYRTNLAKRLLAALPIASLDWTESEMNWDKTIPPKEAEVMETMNYQRTLDDCTDAEGCRRLYYGAILGHGGGIGYLPGSAAAGWVPRDDFGWGRQTHSHEVGHNLGLDHPVHGTYFARNAAGHKQGPCGEEAALANTPDFPHYYPIGGALRAALGPMNSGDDALVYGLDTEAMLAVSPFSFFDLLGYCSNAPIDLWPSEYTLQLLRTAITSRFGPQPKPIAPMARQDYLAIRGVVDYDTGMATLLPFGLLLNSAADPVQPGPYTLRLRDSAGVILNEVPFALETYDDQIGGSFLIPVTPNPAINRAEIVYGGVVIGSRVASPNAPSLTITTPNGGEDISTARTTLSWTANDPDGDSLTFVIQFSKDGGTSWRTLAVDWKAQTYEIGREVFQATATGLLRVLASDGFHVTVDDSNAVFSVANNPPRANLVSPEDGALYLGDQSIFFDAMSFDPEDRQLAAGSLSWTSSLNGSLGARNGFAIRASSLAEGQHLITVTATDTQGSTSTASATITVARQSSSPLSDVAAEIIPITGAVAQGGTITYRVAAVNHGPESLSDLTLTFSAVQEQSSGTAPAPIVGVNAGEGWTCQVASQVVTCNRDDLATAARAAVTVRVGPALMGTIRGRAEVSSTLTDPATANNLVMFEMPVIQPIRGDTNGDTVISLADVFYLINHLFATGSSPIGDGDVNGDGLRSSADVIYLIVHLFAGGPPPQ